MAGRFRHVASKSGQASSYLRPEVLALPDDKRLIATLASMPEYAQHFRQAFPGEKQPVNPGNVARVIAAFEMLDGKRQHNHPRKHGNIPL